MTSEVLQYSRFGENFKYYSNIGFIREGDRIFFEFGNLQNILSVWFDDGIRVKLFAGISREEDRLIFFDLETQIRPSTSKLTPTRVKVIETLLEEEGIGKDIRDSVVEDLKRWKC